MSERKLNKRERHKAALSPYAYYPQIETLDFSAISEGDGFYLQDFGIFNTPIEEESYTIRLRISAGRITPDQLDSIAQIAQEHSLEIILTARAGIQLHGLESTNVLAVFKYLNDSGISTWQTFGDNIRNIVTDIYDGRGCTNRIETYPLIKRMEEYFLKTPRLVGMLPRRISVGISGSAANITSFFANDLYFRLAQSNGEYGFNVYIGGKNTETARCADIFLLPEETVDFFIAFIEAFNRYGLRFTRTHTRLFHLLEEIGMEAFLSYVAHYYPRPWRKKGESVSAEREISSYERLKDGTYAFCYTTDYGRVNTDELRTIADFARNHGAEVRLGTDQNLYLLGLFDPHSPFENRPYSRSIVACAGSHYCPYSFWNIKDDASLLPLEKISRYGIQIGISGCAKGCGRHQHCDIGLIGLRTNQFGTTDMGARIYIGAEYSMEGSVGRELFEMVPIDQIRSVIELIVDEFEHSGRKTFESFSREILNRHSIEFIALWLLAKLETGSAAALSEIEGTEDLDDESRYETEKERILDSFQTLILRKGGDDSLADMRRRLIRRLWISGESDPDIAPEIKKLLVSKKYWEL